MQLPYKAGGASSQTYDINLSCSGNRDVLVFTEMNAYNTHIYMFDCFVGFLIQTGGLAQVFKILIGQRNFATKSSKLRLLADDVAGCQNPTQMLLLESILSI